MTIIVPIIGRVLVLVLVMSLLRMLAVLPGACVVRGERCIMELNINQNQRRWGSQESEDRVGS